MKPDKNSRTKVIILVVVLALVWVVIGIRYIALSRYWKGKIAAQEAQHPHPTGDEDPASTTPASATSAATSPAQTPEATASRQVAALLTPVAPPKSDPFQPAISPRSSSRTAAGPAAAQPETLPVVPLPPPPSPSASTDRNRLRVNGIIAGDPSVPRIAVLRVGEEHFLVREGQRLDGNIVVETINSSSVVLRDSRGTYTLRLNQ